jgi:dTDP-glucose 4,6-dehydratase
VARAYFQTYGLPVLTSKGSNNYGTHQLPEKLIPLMILNVPEGNALPIYGDGRQIRDWLYVEDHARALVAALMRGTPGEVDAIGGGGELTNLALARMLCAGLDVRQPRVQGRYEDLITFVEDRPGHDRRYAIDATKARRELDYSGDLCPRAAGVVLRTVADIKRIRFSFTSGRGTLLSGDY